MISRNSDQIPQKSRRKITNLRRFQQHFAKISKNYRNFANFRKKSANFEFKAVQRYVYLVDLEKCLKNEYLVAKIGLDTAENEPSEKCGFGCCVPPPPRTPRKSLPFASSYPVVVQQPDNSTSRCGASTYRVVTSVVAVVT